MHLFCICLNMKGYVRLESTTCSVSKWRSMSTVWHHSVHSYNHVQLSDEQADVSSPSFVYTENAMRLNSLHSTALTIRTQEYAPVQEVYPVRTNPNCVVPYVFIHNRCFNFTAWKQKLSPNRSKYREKNFFSWIGFLGSFLCKKVGRLSANISFQ